MDLDTVGPVRAWAAATGALFVAVVGGSLLFSRRVYAGFIWQYFWGPVYADANGAFCAVWNGGARELLGQSACETAEGIVAVRGYTVVNEIGYMVVLLLALVGVILLLRRLNLGEDRRFFFALLPYVFLGGALRVVEDVFDAARFAGVEPAVSYPLNSLLISPVIYFTMFALTLATLLLSVAAERRGAVEGYHRPLFGAGVAFLAVTLGWLFVRMLTAEHVEFHPLMLVLTLGIATVATAGTWWIVENYAPAVLAGTGRIGVVVIWGHAVDGAANVLLMDWGVALGVGRYLPKHPANAAVDTVTRAILPSGIADVIGTVWPFLLLKLAVASIAVWLFNEEIMEESPRYSILLLVAIIAVGLGPGTRDMLRATFGV